MSNTLRLTLTVRYDLNDTSLRELEGNLEYMVGSAIGNGLLTGDTDAEVDHYAMHVEVLADGQEASAAG